MQSASSVLAGFSPAKTHLAVKHRWKLPLESPRIRCRVWTLTILSSTFDCFTRSGRRTAERCEFSVFHFDSATSSTFASNRVEGKVAAQLLKCRAERSWPPTGGASTFDSSHAAGRRAGLYRTTRFSYPSPHRPCRSPTTLTCSMSSFANCRPRRVARPRRRPAASRARGRPTPDRPAAPRLLPRLSGRAGSRRAGRPVPRIRPRRAPGW